MTRVLAVDVGFGFTKAMDGTDVQIFKSVIGEANPSPFDGSLVRLPDRFARGISFEDGDFFLGEMAERFSLNQMTALDFGQNMAQQMRPLAFAALLPFCESGEKVNVVTGTPVGMYRRHHQDVQKALAGVHEIEVILDGRKRRKQVLNIDTVRVIPQPVGSAYLQMLDEHGNIADNGMANEKYGIIDIGLHTCDYAICDHTAYVDRGSRSTENGIFSAYKVIADEIEAKSGIEVDLPRLINAVRRGQIKLRDKTMDLNDLKQDVFSVLAKRIAADADVLWQKDWDCKSILITGGAGETLYPYIESALSTNADLVYRGSDLRVANVIGYHRYGEFIWNGHGEAENEDHPSAGSQDDAEVQAAHTEEGHEAGRVEPESERLSAFGAA